MNMMRGNSLNQFHRISLFALATRKLKMYNCSLGRQVFKRNDTGCVYVKLYELTAFMSAFNKW